MFRKLIKKQDKYIKAVGSRSCILYSSSKVNKAIVDVCPPFRPILSANWTPTHKITVSGIHIELPDYQGIILKRLFFICKRNC